MRGVALAGALSLSIVACDSGPQVRLGDEPVGDGIFGTGGAGLEGTPEARELNWARGPDGVVDGKVQGTEFRRLIVDDAKGNRHYLTFNPGTIIRRDGQPASALVLEPGAEVRASYVTWKGDQVVSEIEVIAPPRHLGPLGEARVIAPPNGG